MMKLNIKFTSFFTVLFCLTFVAKSQQLINGNLSTGALNGLSVQAPSGYTWSEIQNGNNTLGYVGTAGTYLLADDFTVCSNWTLSKITLYAYVTTSSTLTSSPFNDLRLAIYNGDPQVGGSSIVYGSLSTNVYQSSFRANVYRVANSTTDYTRELWKIEFNLSYAIAPGTYWLAYSLGNTLSLASNVPPSTVVGSLTQIGNNAKQLNISTICI